MINLLILVVETNSKTKSDDKYISSFIKRFYNISGIKYDFVYMDGKGNYANVLPKVDKMRTKNKSLSSEVIYFIDVDYSADASKNTQSINLNKQIAQFTKNHNFDLVQFNYDIEDVFLGKQISDSDKERESTKFLCNNSINNVNESFFTVKNPATCRHRSNLSLVLDKYLPKK